MRRRQEYGNSVSRNNPNGIRINQTGAINKATGNKNTTRNVGVQSDSELYSNTKITPIDYNKNYNGINLNEHQYNRENTQNIFDFNNDYSESNNFKSYNSNQKSLNFKNLELPNLYRNYDLNIDDELDFAEIKPYRNQARYNYGVKPLEPIIQNNDNNYNNKVNYFYDTKRNK